MNAIQLLEQQHRQIDELFTKFFSSGHGAKKTRERIALQIADNLAVHAEIEEKLFYPEAKQAASDAEEILRESVEEHLSVKRICADLLNDHPDDPQFEAKVKVMKDQIQHHVQEEEQELFPQVQKVCSKEQLEDLGNRMEQLAKQLLKEGEPRQHIPEETGAPAPL